MDESRKDLILTGPTLQEIDDFHVSSEVWSRLRELLEANETRRLTDAESAQLDGALQLNQAIAKLKICVLYRLS